MIMLLFFLMEAHHCDLLCSARHLQQIATTNNRQIVCTMRVGTRGGGCVSSSSTARRLSSGSTPSIREWHRCSYTLHGAVAIRGALCLCLCVHDAQQALLIGHATCRWYEHRSTMRIPSTRCCSSRMVRFAILINPLDPNRIPFHAGVIIDLHIAGHMEAFNRAFAVRAGDGDDV